MSESFRGGGRAGHVQDFGYYYTDSNWLFDQSFVMAHQKSTLPSMLATTCSFLSSTDASELACTSRAMRVLVNHAAVHRAHHAFALPVLSAHSSRTFALVAAMAAHQAPRLELDAPARSSYVHEHADARLSATPIEAFHFAGASLVHRLAATLVAADASPSPLFPRRAALLFYHSERRALEMRRQSLAACLLWSQFFVPLVLVSILVALLTAPFAMDTSTTLSPAAHRIAAWMCVAVVGVVFLANCTCLCFVFAYRDADAVEADALTPFALRSSWSHQYCVLGLHLLQPHYERLSAVSHVHLMCCAPLLGATFLCGALYQWWRPSASSEIALPWMMLPFAYACSVSALLALSFVWCAERPRCFANMACFAVHAWIQLNLLVTLPLGFWETPTNALSASLAIALVAHMALFGLIAVWLAVAGVASLKLAVKHCPSAVRDVVHEVRAHSRARTHSCCTAVACKLVDLHALRYALRAALVALALWTVCLRVWLCVAQFCDACSVCSCASQVGAPSDAALLASTATTSAALLVFALVACAAWIRGRDTMCVVRK